MSLVNRQEFHDRKTRSVGFHGAELDSKQPSGLAQLLEGSSLATALLPHQDQPPRARSNSSHSDPRP